VIDVPDTQLEAEVTQRFAAIADPYRQPPTCKGPMKYALVLAAAVGLVAVFAAPATAFVERWPVFYSHEFSGAACGDTDVLRVPLPRRARIDSIRTKVGDPLRNIDTRLITARVTKVQVVRETNRRAVDFTVAGSDDVCAHPDHYLDGWTAWHTMYIRASRVRRPTWHSCADVGPKHTDTAVYDIRMLRISCASGRRILRAWYYDRYAPDAGPRGWACHVKVSRSSERHYCQRGERRIRFTLFYA
jgi:hypothetical protein